MRKDVIFGLALALAASGTAVQAAELNDWDTSEDAVLDQNEFGTGLDSEGVFDAYEEDDDGVIGEEEWNAIGTDITWDDWDSDGEFGLDEDEFEAGLFDYGDANDDQLIGGNEWTELEEDGWFDV